MGEKHLYEITCFKIKKCIKPIASDLKNILPCIYWWCGYR